jgi:conserved oligomeric Golgi complex subunit 3
VNICRQSLVSASELMKASKTSTSPANGGSQKLDGELFLVRHLLILKEMTQNLDLVNRDAVNRTVDLSAVTGEYFSSILCSTP